MEGISDQGMNNFFLLAVQKAGGDHCLLMDVTPSFKESYEMRLVNVEHSSISGGALIAPDSLKNLCWVLLYSMAILLRVSLLLH